jgi:hypothetical protein
LRAFLFRPSAVVAALLGLALIYCLAMEALTRLGYRRTWKQAKHFRYEPDVGVEGVRFSSAAFSKKPEWFEINRYIETDGLLVLCNERKRLAVPKRLFRGEAARDEFLQLIRVLIKSDQEKNALAIDP